MINQLPTTQFRIPNLNHHIYDNNGSWWLHCTVHRPDYTKERIRISLRTKDLLTARRRRDFVLRNLPGVVGTKHLQQVCFEELELKAAA
jgi:hypothetical protein